MNYSKKNYKLSKTNRIEVSKTLKQITIALLMLITIGVMAQQGINYKALIKDASGNVIANDLIQVQFSVLQGVALTNVYQENHAPTTDTNGLIILNIGKGTILSGDFNTIDWSINSHFLNVQINTGAGLVDLGTTEFMAVPYALHAKTVDNSVASINDLIDGKSDNDGAQNGSSIFIGIDAGLNDDQTDNKNVGIGYQALLSNTTGSRNTANGYQALSNNTTGFQNTANGFETLFSNTTGFFNTATGFQALLSNTTGTRNTANGFRALRNNTTGSVNTANGNQALESNTTGDFNTANGFEALFINTEGSSNTANGSQTLRNNTTGDFNTANGSEALESNTTGSRNTANGSEALRNNTTGDFNTANGYQSLESNTTGSRNTANGFQALLSNTTGNVNTANGNEALRKNTTGFQNTANGFQALFSNTTGSENTANGAFALINITTGIQNTANGLSSLFVNTTGSGNVALGYQAGFNETGSNTLYIDNSSTSSPLIYGEFDTNRLNVNGKLRITSVSNNDATLSDGSGYFIIGSESGTNIVMDNNEIMARSNGSTSTLFLQNDGGALSVGGNIVHNSDRRLKKDIETLPYGLKEILQLQPKAYNWKNRDQNYKSLGLIAQEVQPILKEIVTTQDNEQKTLGISYTELIPILIKAIQDQQKIITNQNTKIENLSAELTPLKSLEKRILDIENNLKSNQ